MPGGRTRKPTHLKVVSGTAQKCRINPDEPAGTSGNPQPPDWLSDRATAIFYETIADMERLGTLALEWGPVIADYASAREEVEVTTAIVEDLGRTYTTVTQTGGTMHRARPEVAMRADAMRRSQALRAELGLGPASKSKVSASKKKQGNPFQALIG
jgi:P27 family predicted phage terminase small subunit